ncbi:hypothetical protein AVEN_48560-1, partial [Araneus ventricosus]
TFRTNVGKFSDIKESESMAGGFSTVPTSCCRLCMHSGNGASGRVPETINPPRTKVDRRKPDHRNRASDH